MQTPKFPRSLSVSLFSVGRSVSPLPESKADVGASHEPGGKTLDTVPLLF